MLLVNAATQKMWVFMLAIMSITALVLYQGYGLQECNVTCDAVSCCVCAVADIFSNCRPSLQGWAFYVDCPTLTMKAPWSSRLLTLQTQCHISEELNSHQWTALFEPHILYLISHNEPRMSCIKWHSLLDRFEVLMVLSQCCGVVACDAT